MQPPNNQGKLARLNQRWLGWTQPDHTLTANADRIRAQALTSVLLFIFIIGMLFQIVELLLDPKSVKYLPTQTPLILLIGGMTFFSRGKHYRFVALAVAGLISFGSFGLTIQSAYPTSLIFISLSYFVVATALPTTRAFFIGILNILLAMSAPSFVTQWTSYDDIVIELAFIILATVIVYTLTYIQRYYIDLSEANAVELAVTNQLLEEKIKHLEEVTATIEQSQQNFKKIFYASPDPIVINRLSDGKYMDFNWSFLDATEYTADELKHSNGSQLFASPTIARDYIKRLVTDNNIFSAEYDIKTKSGEVRSALLSSEIIEWNGETCIVCMARDITAHKQAQQHQLKILHEQERSTLLQKFITDASHDFRTPLATIGTSLYLLEKSEDKARRHHHIQVIEQQSNRIEKLVDGLMLMSQLDSQHIRFQFFPTDLNQLIQFTVAQYPNPENIAIKLDLDANVPLIAVDGFYFQIAIKHLLDNALRFTPTDGQITISTRVCFAVDHVRFMVEDTGMGMDEETLKHSFERLYRGDSARNQTTGGAGLGLSITEQIINAHRGTIIVKSTPGAGSCFTIDLPVQQLTVPIGAN